VKATNIPDSNYPIDKPVDADEFECRWNYRKVSGEERVLVAMFNPTASVCPTGRLWALV